MTEWMDKPAAREPAGFLLAPTLRRFKATERRVKHCLTMAEPLKTVAVLVANPALSSILSMTLAGAPSLRVRPFDTEAALRSYLQVAHADLIVTDFDSLPARADRLADRLRSEAAIPKRTQIVALASEISPAVKAASIDAGIDEIIMKPMSPRYLVERVLARLARARVPERRRGLHKRDWSAFGDNIVPMVRPAPEARP
jgi:PleD family two-component response regulator